jgi:uncharacterized protein (DUF58 family)
MHLQLLLTLVVQQLVIIRSQLVAALQLLLPHLRLAAGEAVAVAVVVEVAVAAAVVAVVAVQPRQLF